MKILICLSLTAAIGCASQSERTPSAVYSSALIKVDKDREQRLTTEFNRKVGELDERAILCACIEPHSKFITRPGVTKEMGDPPLMSALGLITVSPPHPDDTFPKAGCQINAKSGNSYMCYHYQVLP